MGDATLHKQCYALASVMYATNFGVYVSGLYGIVGFAYVGGGGRCWFLCSHGLFLRAQDGVRRPAGATGLGVRLHAVRGCLGLL